MPNIIDIGKEPDQLFETGIVLENLPTDTPYGDFQLKWMDMVSRLNEANKQIIISYETWDQSAKGDRTDSMRDIFNTHRFSTEYAVIGMRRVADELIALMYCMEHRKSNGDYPDQIKADSLGAAFKEKYKGPENLLDRHTPLITLLNDISNTLKHSFIQSNVDRLGHGKPIVIALNLHRANLSNKVETYVIGLSQLVRDYTNFFHDCRDYLASV